MKYIKGTDRSQTALFPVSLDQAIEPHNEVRIIDLFVDSLNIEEMGFRTGHQENGRPAYHPKDLLKIYIYGYMNRTRSSRELEKECKRNIELMWLVKCLAPDHNTISNFRRDNPRAIREVFRQTVSIAKNFDLIGGKLLAGDSTKVRAQNSKKNNYNQKKVKRHLEYIEKKLDQYQEQLSEADGDSQAQIQAEIEKQEGRKQFYRDIQQQLDESGQPQVSTSDPESRQMITRNNITEVAYSIQTTVDGKNKLPIDYKVTNQNDSKAMGPMLRRAKAIIGHNDFTALYDKGYHTGSGFAIADRLGIQTLVAIPAISGASKAPTPEYDVQNFEYSPGKDCYTCPQGQELYSNGTWYYASKKAYRFRQFKTPKCKTCPAQHLCTKSKINGKIVQRSEFTKNIEANKERMINNERAYKKRQAIVEHPYGTIKRQWGFGYIMTKKGIKRASADVGLVFISYNLRRLINILGAKAFGEWLAAFFGHIMAILEATGRFFGQPKQSLIYNANKKKIVTWQIFANFSTS